MPRTVCAWTPRFELAARFAREPGYAELPLVLADAGSARARVLEASPAAVALGVRAGMGLAEARAVCPGLELRPPDPAAVRRAEEAILAELYRLSPVVGRDGAGAFFLSLAGTERLHPDEVRLARRVRGAVEAHAPGVRVGVAGGPLGAWLAARRAEEPGRIRVVAAAEEAAFLASLPVDALPMPAEVARLCRVLGLDRVADLQRLPPGALARRFGRAGADLQQRAFARSEEVFRVETPVVPEEAALDLDDPCESRDALLFVLRGLLAQVLERVAAGRVTLAALEVRLALADGEGGAVRRTLRPARPTLEARAVFDLLTLWLAGEVLPAGVTAVRLRAVEVCPATRRQLSLFQRREARAEEALAAAVARLVAAFGAGAVVHPELADSHRPEARIRWRPVGEGGAPVGGRGAPGQGEAMDPLPVLRLLDPPRRVRLRMAPLRRGGRFVGWLSGPAGGSRRVVGVAGPYRVEGEWWTDAPLGREYRLLATAAGELLWIFRDGRGTYLHARVD